MPGYRCCRFLAGPAPLLFIATLLVSCGGGGASAPDPITATAESTAQNLTVGVAMSSFFPLTASGGVPPYTYRYTGTLPAGLSFDAGTGAMTGTPTATYATANLVFSVRDANNVTASTTSTVSFTVFALITREVNDTGITASQCYQTRSDALVACDSAGAIALNNAQDGMTGRDANAATNGNADGKLGFSFSEVAGGCVQDNVSGLMWEVKTADSGLRDWTRTYTNFGDGRPGDASAYPALVNATNLCGYNDWRLPTANELLSIVDYGVGFPGPTIDATWFPNTQADHFWTATSHVDDPGQYAWVVHFYHGWDYYFYGRAGTFYVRLVRGDQ